MKVIHIDKFTETTASIRCVLPLDKKTITLWNLLVFMMKSKTEKFSTKQELSLAFSKAYGLKASFGINAYGEHLILDTRFQWIRTDWIEASDYSSKLIELMDQLIFHSLLDEKNLEEAKYLLRLRLLRFQDDPDHVAMNQAFVLVENHSISIPVQGCIQDIDTITLEDVKACYQVLKEAPKHVYVCGILEDSIKSYLETIDQEKPIYNQRTIVPYQDFKMKEMEKDIYQTSLVNLYSTGVDIQSDEYYTLIVLCSLLGQSPMNLLFENVREKNSLCYSIHSQLIRFDGVLLIHAGVERENVDLALELIDTQLHSLKTQSYSDESLEIAKKDLTDGLYSSKDLPFSMIEQVFLNDYLNRDLTLDDQIQKIQSITKEDIAKVASQIRQIVCSIVKEAYHEG